MKKPSLKISGVKTWVKTTRQKRKEKEELERHLESSALKMVTFIVTAAAMALGMSYLPLFPSPIPIFLAVLVAFVAYQKPRLGMPIGGAIIGLGLMYQLSIFRFISFLGDTAARVVFLAVWMTLFIVAPLLFNRYKAALAIDFGILAVVALFVGPTYFLAIPLILASVVFFRKYAGLTVVYYVLMSVPFQIMQYFNYIQTIARSDWWVTVGSAPPIFVSLSDISSSVGESMSQFRLYDASNAIYSILGQTTWIPDWKGRTIADALNQYLDSLPGILMFVVIVVGLALTLIFFTRMLVKEGLVGSGDKLFPCFTATIGAALFFILLSAMQVPLAFTADVSGTTMVLGIVCTLLFTLPVAFMDYTPKQRASNREITDKAQALLSKVLAFENQLDNVKANIPAVVTAPEGKMLIIKDSLQEILKNASNHVYEQDELDEKFSALEKLGKDNVALEAELGAILCEYQIYAHCQLSDWTGKLKGAGLNIQTPVKVPFEKELPLEQRIEAIKQVLAGGDALVNDVIAVAQPIYAIIRPLYDQSLPEKCRAVEFAQEKLAKREAPWIAIDALYNSLNNWKRQYGSEIQASMRYLQNSLSPVMALVGETKVLPSVFGDNTAKVVAYTKKAETIRLNAESRAEKDELDFSDVIALKDDVQGFLSIADDILTMLYNGLVSDEEAIDRLLPTKDYLWEKNTTLRERLRKATDMLSDPSKYKINQIMQNLPEYLSYVEEAVQTAAVYSERKEFLLNYPLAQAAIEERLKTKERLLPRDLPFEPKFAAEYLRLYYSARYGEYAFDKDNLVLTKRP